MKDKIIKFVKENPYCTIGTICANFSVRKNDLMKQLAYLEVSGDLIREDNSFITPFNLGLIKATVVSVKRRYAFLNISDTDEDVVIEEKHLNGALLNDIVYLKYDLFFKVIKIVYRERKTVVGELIKLKNGNYLKVNGIATDNTIFEIEDYNGEENEILKCSITSYEGNKIYLQVDELLGNKNAPGVDITRILLEHDCPVEFDDEVLLEVANISNEVREDEIQNRLDLRDKLIMTIDGEDSKDLDDAISVDELSDGYLIGVHIADVSHYVKEYSEIDKEALNRGTSIYVADRVVPMLPFELSNGICSLNPHVDRLCISCLMKLNSKYQVVETSIKESIINSKHRLTYTYVNDVILNHKDDSILNSKILLLDKIAKALRKQKYERGELELNVPEIKIKANKDGEAVGVEKRIQKDGEKLIEDLMILANEKVAETIYSMNLPFIYRIHDNPPAKRMETLLAFIMRIGLKARFDIASVKPKELQAVLEEGKENPKNNVLKEQLLRSLAKAKYNSQNKGHFGLASRCYTHFTSPIRRYPDLLVHRLIRKYIFNKQTNDAYSKLDEINFIAEMSSIKERRAITVERDSNDMKCAELMRKYIGAEFKGYISGMSSSGMYVELNNGISGKVSFELMNDYYAIDKNSFYAVGRRKGKRYSLGDQVTVVIESANKEQKEIIFRIVGENLSYQRRKEVNNRRRKR